MMFLVFFSRICKKFGLTAQSFSGLRVHILGEYQTTKVLKGRIKRSSRAIPLWGDLLSILARLVTEVSEEDDHLLLSPRLAVLHGEKDSLSLKTGGYHWYQTLAWIMLWYQNNQSMGKPMGRSDKLYKMWVTNHNPWTQLVERSEIYNWMWQA